MLAAFKSWATEPGETGWVLGDTLARAADRSKASQLADLASDDRYGPARGCIVEALWRFKSVADVEQPLRQLVADPDVSLMAMTALQRTIGAKPPRRSCDTSSPPPRSRPCGNTARRQLKRIETKLARSAADT